MRTGNFKNLVAGLLLLATAPTMFTACSKGDDNPSPGEPPNPGEVVFKTTDFEVNIYDKEINKSFYYVKYEVKNKKNTPYIRNDENGKYSIRFKVKTTDGSEYQNKETFRDMGANGSFSTGNSIFHPDNKTVNESTLTYEVYLE